MVNLIRERYPVQIQLGALNKWEDKSLIGSPPCSGDPASPIIGLLEPLFANLLCQLHVFQLTGSSSKLVYSFE